MLLSSPTTQALKMLKTYQSSPVARQPGLPGLRMSRGGRVSGVQMGTTSGGGCPGAARPLLPRDPISQQKADEVPRKGQEANRAARSQRHPVSL